MTVLIEEQELVVHVFAHAGGPYAEKALADVREMWGRCQSRLGMTEPVPNVDLPMTFPDSLRAGSAELAACQHKDTNAQAVLRHQHDVLNLSALLSGPGNRWSSVEHTMNDLLGDLTPGVFGVAWLYLGKLPDVDQRTPQPDVVPGANAQWCQGVGLGSGVMAWEVSPRTSARAQRKLLVLARPDRDHALSVWTWSDGGVAMPPLARYLMHLAKLRYQLRVHGGFPDVGELCSVSEDARSRLASGGRAASAELHEALVEITRVATAVRAMQRTVEIGRFNAALALREAQENPVNAPNFVGDDQAMAQHFAHRLDDDRTYLENQERGASLLAELTRNEPQKRGTTARVEPPAERSDSDQPTFAVITAMPQEFVAVRATLDDVRPRIVPDDTANYVVGTMPSALPNRLHTVVLTMLGETANNAAADGCANLVRSFGTVSCVLMVGVAAGVPDPARPRNHVRLGDIVVATWGVADYDHVVATPDGVSPRQGHPRPSPLLGHAAKLLQASELEDRRPWEDQLEVMLTNLSSAFSRPDPVTDVLHGEGGQPQAHPDPAISGHRSGKPKVHYGKIGSADRSVRDQQIRDQVAATHDVRAIEMEATGVGKSSFAGGREWFVVRGISDYADREMTFVWREYAALVAAAYTRALLGVVPPLALHHGRFRLPDD